MRVNVDKYENILNIEVANKTQLTERLERYISLAEKGIRGEKDLNVKNFMEYGIDIANDWSGEDTNEYTGWYWLGVIHSPQTDSYILCFDYCGGGNMVTLGLNYCGECEDYEKEDFIKRMFNTMEAVGLFPFYIPVAPKK